MMVLMMPVCLTLCAWTLAAWVTPFQPASCQTYVQWFCRLVYICAEELADVYRALADKKVRSCLCSWRLLCWLCTLPPIISVSQQLPCFPPLGLGANMSHFRWPPQAFEKHACWMQQKSCHPQSACLQVSTGKHCVQWLADYIVEAATPAADQSWAQADAGHPELTAAALLRQGAYALYGACSPLEVRHALECLKALE